MGSLQAEEFAALVGQGELALDHALTWHLQSNHYPPIPVTFVPVCKKAITKANAGKWEAKIRLPAGCFYRGTKTAPVWAIVEQHHLNSFLQEESR